MVLAGCTFGRNGDLLLEVNAARLAVKVVHLDGVFLVAVELNLDAFHGTLDRELGLHGELSAGHAAVGRRAGAQNLHLGGVSIHGFQRYVGLVSFLGIVGIGHRQREVVGAGSQSGRQLQVLVELGVEHAHVLAVGINPVGAARSVLLDEGHLDGFNLCFRLDAALHVQVLAHHGLTRVLFSHLHVAESHVGHGRGLVVIVAGSERQGEETQERESSNHPFVFHRFFHDFVFLVRPRPLVRN